MAMFTTGFLADCIRVLHILFVMFMVAVPFTTHRSLLVLHLVITPFLWVHWLVNDDTCALTLVESRLRGVPHTHSFFHALVSPVYKIADADVRVACWAASLGLWLLTLTKVGWADVVEELAPLRAPRLTR